MVFKLKYILFGLLLLSSVNKLIAQKFNVDGGVILKAEIALGNQNQWLKLGAFSFGTLNYGDVSVENGFSFSIYGFSKRHTISTFGTAYNYEYFALVGIGKNSNLLGSSVSNLNNEIIFNPSKKGGFKGIGFGFEKNVLPKELENYSLRRGQFHMRFSNADYDIHLTFLNDFRLGRIFNGEGTDYGATGSLKIGFTKIRTFTDVYKLGVGLDIFTPQQDHSRSPRAKLNSDDGRKNVWFTLPPLQDLFYANLYGIGTYQNENLNLTARLGLNSSKLGAYMQNKIHDGVGVNPRFPWNVSLKDKLYIELYGSGIYMINDEY